MASRLKAAYESADVRALAALIAEVAAERDAAAAERDAAAAERDAAAAERDAAAAERDALVDTNTALTEKASALGEEVETLAQSRAQLQQRVDYLTRMLFGRRSEKLTREELGQLALAFGASEEEANEADPKVPTPDGPTHSNDGESAVSDGMKKRRKRRHPGRTRLSPELERRVTPVPVPEGERTCKCCGGEMACIGHLDHERVEYEPAQLIVHVERREKLACKDPSCRGDAVTAERKAPRDTHLRVGSSFLAHLVESKCDDALPIYRQRDQLKRLGFDVPLNTLYGYWSYVTNLLRPVADTTLSVVLGDPHYVALDDTKLDVLDKTKAKGIYRGHLWCFTGTTPLVAYGFTKTWGANEIVPWVSAIEGFIQCDDYKGYSSSVDWPGGGARILIPPERRLGCMMHLRRRFVEAFKQSDKRAAEPLALIKALYEIEAEAKDKGLGHDARGALRAERSLPILDQLEQWVDDHDGKLLPSSLLGQAVGYAKQQRAFVRRCFRDGRFEIDNGHTERQIREPAVGRKNFLFTGSAEAAKALAGAYTLVQSCRNLGVPAREYLIDVIDKLERGWPVRRIRELVPDRWAELHRVTPPTDDLPQHVP
jgi:transposase